MLWTELELDRRIPDDRLRDAWAQAFALPQDAVAIVDDLTQARPSTDPRVRIVLERYGQPGAFPLHVTIVLHGQELDASVAGHEKTLAMVKQLCAALKCHVLISDEGANPYERLLITPAGEDTLVRLDPEQFDEDQAFALAEQPVTAGTAV